MQSLSAAAIVDKLKSLFSRLGLPKSLVSSGDALFSSQLFSQYCKASGIQQIFTQQSDIFVVTFQFSFDKWKKVGIRQKNINRFLEIYRNAPSSALGAKREEELQERAS
uniref:Integrase catalytic domain-containing protein n=1 Tax=Ditylenchus dipsaci TaxID=166011 RepID=A0A915DSY0_9BILA